MEKPGQPSATAGSRIPEPVYEYGLEKRRESRLAWAGVGCRRGLYPPNTRISTRGSTGLRTGAGQGRPLSPCVEWGGADLPGTAPPVRRRFKRLLRGSERGRSRSLSERN